MSRFPEIDVKKLKTYSIRRRRSKVRSASSARPPEPGASFEAFWKGLPDVLAVRELRELAGFTADAVRRKKPVLLLSGAHVIKVGLSPVVIRLMEKGVLSGVAFNGAGAVHDAELAYFGATSEEVEKTIRNGRFGMARETARILNEAAVRGAAEGLGFGEALGKRILEDAPPDTRSSILAQAARLGVPVTVHVAIGTDIVHPHPSADGAAIGETSLRDFRILAEQVSRLGNGGVVLLFGSAVVLPEVFLKALATARNIKGSVAGFFTASFDMNRHYRPRVNVVERPTADGGRGYTFTGHHEIMMPLFASVVLEALHAGSRGRGR
jgi:hypothetical protein